MSAKFCGAEQWTPALTRLSPRLEKERERRSEREREEEGGGGVGWRSVTGGLEVEFFAVTICLH